ncbi:hypothetical protein [Archangium sp.]|uniref:hypothetical protein n=1 Tax=Archangium sp. TaxID=1872627 RepID=UPI003899CC8F
MSVYPRRTRGSFFGSAPAGASGADFLGPTVLTRPGHENEVYELAGDTAFTMTELAAEVSRKAGKAIAYNHLPPEQYQGILEGAGVPGPFAGILADSGPESFPVTGTGAGKESMLPSILIIEGGKRRERAGPCGPRQIKTRCRCGEPAPRVRPGPGKPLSSAPLARRGSAQPRYWWTDLMR